MTPFEVTLFIGIWSALMLAGAAIVDKKKNPGGNRGSRRKK